MRYLDATLPTPEANLACDEALLTLCEEGLDDEVLRFWEPQQHFIVLGYSKKVKAEVHEHACAAKRIPMLRRFSGGGTVLQGPGCLNYSLILRIGNAGPLSTIAGTNSFVMERHKDAVQGMLNNQVQIQGHTDLAIGGMKFSGNAQRRKERYLLFHGTFLLHFDISLAQEVLAIPSRQPPYRSNRSHLQFMTNLNVEAGRIKNVLRKAWLANQPLQPKQIPLDRINELVRTRYSRKEWNHRL